METGQQMNHTQGSPCLSSETELTVDHNGELKEALPPLVGDGEAHGLDAPLGHPVHAPHQETLCCGSRRCLNVQKDGL